ncbi:NeuD/PglB/VioB family sugar acetyltransferase [Saccharothrix australiensis]|uniref:Sugar O-acyltransferase (Sialic acid O-acetyltransferase NeuD family) n=1 Tax=Saccharothrix australiensis TaxID=2072 RepID=A0A495VXH9_9PSEU|nr:NeuD/PglB/VioB family sugar acetyltransferase [Saccharothrix australiensis]RKT53959.1 sugar O-acyltransferase (sialic acid O-acetyltransferase NeuD family) [Saccharothrix australiensis]
MTPRPLLLVGGGGLAREVLAAVRLRPEEWAPVGALDDDPARHGADLDGLPVLGGSELVHGMPDAAVLVCVASARRPAGRMAVVRRLDLPEDRWARVVHPAASVPPGAVVGPGTVLLAGVVVTTPLRLGAHVVAMPHVLVTHDDEVGDGVTFAGRASLGGAVRVGECAYLGQGASVREGVSIGAGAVVGMGSVVLTDVPAGEVWAGVPARRLREGNGS